MQKAAVEATMPEAPPRRTAGEGDGERTTTTNWKPVETSLEDELKEAGDEATKALREKQRQMIDSLDLSKCVACLGELAARASRGCAD